MTSFDSGSNVGIGKEGIDARVRCSPASRLIGRSSGCTGSSRGPAPRARARERRPNGAQRSHLRRGPRGNKNGFGFCAGSDSRSPPRAVSLKWWPAPCVALCASPRSTRRFRPSTTRQARLLMSAHATVAGAKPTRRIESAFVGVYGRLKIFEFRVVGLFTQPAANENPYPMKGLLAFATRFPRSNRLGSVRRVNWSSRLALQTFETAERAPRLCGRFSPVVTCLSLHKPNARRHTRWHASWVGLGRTTPPPTRDPPWTRTRTWSRTAATETEGSRSTTRLATPSDACTRTQRWCRTAWTLTLSL